MIDYEYLLEVRSTLILDTVHTRRPKFIGLAQ